MFIMFDKKKLLVVFLIAIISITSSATIILSKETTHTPTISWHIATKSFIIDPGHGGKYPGKISADGTVEKDINLSIATQLNQLLQESGCQSTLTRTQDSDLIPENLQQEKNILQLRADLSQRIALIDTTQADLFISIHCNSIPSDQWSGAQTFYNPNDPDSKLLAESIQKSLKSQLKNTDRTAIAREDTYLFEHTTVPTVIVECGFLSNQEETQRLKDPSYQQKVAYAIFTGIGDYIEATNE